MLEDAAARLAAAGAEIVEAELPNVCGNVSDIQNRHSYFEAPRNHAPERDASRGAAEPGVAARPDRGRARS